jgi:DNA relaxase NicK
MEVWSMAELGAIVSAGLDYLSLTMLNDNPNVVSWEGAALAYVTEIAETGLEPLLSKRLGSEGISIGGSFVGRRERDTIAIFSGERAIRAYDLLYRRDTHASRADVQVSYQFVVDNPNVADTARNQVKRDNAKVSSARQRNATLIEDLKGGATCYIGTRKSEQFGRIYNKAAESNDPRYDRVWRYEVQLKNRIASKLLEQIASKTYTPEMHAVVFVKQWLRHRGVSVPWTGEAELIPLPKDEQLPSDIETRLTWLRMQVRPSLRSLLKYGLRDAILEALGLSDEID